MKKLFYWITVFFIFGLFCVSFFNVFSYLKQENEVKDINAELLELAVSFTDENLFKETAPITIDFEKLREENEDIIAWIYCENTPINYPIVQAEDNDKYLRRLINGNWNIAGTLFLDYRNSDAFSDYRSIIYGHNMDNDTMFGTLTEYENQEYYDNHSQIYLLTPEKNYVIEIFAGYTTDVYNSVYNFPLSKEERIELINESQEKSDFKTDLKITDTDKIISFSTCEYSSNISRYILLGRLREI